MTHLLNDPPPLTLPKSLVLVGMMGSGKSSLGKRLALRFKLPFIDTDHEIEKRAGCTVSEIFARQGEPEFRQIEHNLIRELMTSPSRYVIATGGGAFIQKDSHALIRQQAISLWLEAGIDTLVQRTARRNTRPLLQQGNPREILTRLLAEREAVYATAALKINVDHISLGEAELAVLDALRFYLEPPS